MERASRSRAEVDGEEAVKRTIGDELLGKGDDLDGAVLVGAWQVQISQVKNEAVAWTRNVGDRTRHEPVVKKCSQGLPASCPSFCFLAARPEEICSSAGVCTCVHVCALEKCVIHGRRFSTP